MRGQFDAPGHVAANTREVRHGDGTAETNIPHHSGGADLSRSSFSLVAVGDAMLLHPIAAHMTQPASAAVLDLIRSGDVALANCEVSGFDLSNSDAVPQAECGGLYLNAGCEGIADFKALGFSMVSRANNHATDFGTAGMLETDRQLSEQGIVYAGTGPTLAAARAPAFLTTSAGRVALMSATDSTPRLSYAGYARPDMIGRAGVNMIRSQHERLVDPVIFQSLQAILHLSRQRHCYVGRAHAEPDVIRFFGATVRRAAAGGDAYVLAESDVAANVEAVRIARSRADYVIFALHCHLPSNDSDVAPDAIRVLAHQLVDAGADAVIMCGAHRLRAIEIHRGAPILYGLANFVCHLPKVGPQASDVYESAGLDPRRSGLEELFTPGGKFAKMVDDPTWWESVIARLRYDGSWWTIELHPVDLSRFEAGAQLGTPRMADAAASQRIIDHLATLSAPYGTNVTFRDGMGIVEA